MSPRLPPSLPCGSCGAAVPLGAARPGDRVPCPGCGRLFKIGRRRPGTRATPPPAAGSPVPGYRVLGELGTGGMATVYKARQESLDRVVALKVMATRFSGDPELVRRFEQEAKALAALSHPHIVAVYDRGSHGGLMYFAMEHVEGPTLLEALEAAGGRMAPGRAMHLMSQVASALAYTHKKGTIHRDIKPQNILVSEGERVKVTDFGLAHVFRAEGDRAAPGVVGTPGYMAPEQCAGEPVDHRADIYALGLTFYQLLTGALPGLDGPELDRRRPGLEPRLVWMVERCLEPEPKDRFQSAFHIQELLADLALAEAEKLAAADPQFAAAVGAGEPPRAAHGDVPNANHREELRAYRLLEGVLGGLMAPAGAPGGAGDPADDADDLATRETVAPPPASEPPAAPPPRPPRRDRRPPPEPPPPPADQPEIDISGILRRAREKRRRAVEAGLDPAAKRPALKLD